MAKSLNNIGIHSSKKGRELVFKKFNGNDKFEPSENEFIGELRNSKGEGERNFVINNIGDVINPYFSSEEACSFLSVLIEVQKRNKIVCNDSSVFECINIIACDQETSRSTKFGFLSINKISSPISLKLSMRKGVANNGKLTETISIERISLDRQYIDGKVCTFIYIKFLKVDKHPKIAVAFAINAIMAVCENIELFHYNQHKPENLAIDLVMSDAYKSNDKYVEKHKQKVIAVIMRTLPSVKAKGRPISGSATSDSDEYDFLWNNFDSLKFTLIEEYGVTYGSIEKTKKWIKSSLPMSFGIDSINIKFLDAVPNSLTEDIFINRGRI